LYGCLPLLRFFQTFFLTISHLHPIVVDIINSFLNI
jgi:hypothetical protein